jgi:hypothetical protein
MNTHRLARTTATALVAAALTASTAAAEPVHQRFGSPDAIDNNRETLPPDMRGADARGVPTDAPDVLVVRMTTPAPAPAATDSAVDWPDAMLGAGGVLGLTLITFGGTLVLVHRRRSHVPA